MQGVRDHVSRGDAAGDLSVADLYGKAGKLAGEGAVGAGDREIKKITDGAVHESIGFLNEMRRRTPEFYPVSSTDLTQESRMRRMASVRRLRLLRRDSARRTFNA